MFIIYAEERKENGKSANRRLRITNKFPAIIYGGKTVPVSIELSHDKVWNMQKENEFYSDILTIILNDKKEKVRVQSIQRHPFKSRLIHIDFIRT